jgi:DUF4097 and DUF4098 domain-containing protein YvlB
MKKSLSLVAKLSIFIVFALIFGATMVALSMKSPRKATLGELSWEKGNKIEKTFTVKPGDLLALETDNGEVSVTGTDKREVSIVVTINGSQDRIDKFHVGFDQSGNTVKITGKSEREHFRFFDDGFLNVRYLIEVPAEFNIDVRTAGGDIFSENIKGKIDGETSGGDIELRKLEGPIHMTTSGGNVKMIDCRGTVVVSTSGGNITGDGVLGDMDVETSGGNITIRNSDGKMSGTTSGGDIKVTLKDNKGIELSTSGGSVTVNLPKSVTAEVEASTTGGDVSCDLPFAGKIKNGTMNGTINGGGKLIKLETTGGDISIGPGD